MSGFSIDWLDLREAADRRARDSGLRSLAMEWLQAAHPPAPVVVDLGAGTGSTLRAFDGFHDTPLAWRLVDNDAALLAEARRRHGAQHQVDTVVADLAHVETLPLSGARLVTASALFDLVSASFIDALAGLLHSQARQLPLAVYSALNYDGITRWTPEHSLDESVLQAFNRDQRRDKGFGPALGPEAAGVLRGAFTHAGFTVHSATSPWMLDGDDETLVMALISGIAGAVAGSGFDDGALEDWVTFRQSRAKTGTCTVGHIDLLALPA